MPIKPQAEYRRWWITLLPVQFKAASTTQTSSPKKMKMSLNFKPAETLSASPLLYNNIVNTNPFVRHTLYLLRFAQRRVVKPCLTSGPFSRESGEFAPLSNATSAHPDSQLTKEKTLLSIVAEIFHLFFA